jgi:hypothetical protein
VSGYFRDDETGQYVVSFNPKMAKLYEATPLIDWSERKALGNNLAKWLMGNMPATPNPSRTKLRRFGI